MGLCFAGLPARVDAAAMRESLLTIRVNGVALSESEAVLEPEPGRLYIPTGVFYKGHLRLPQQRATHVAALGLDYYPLDFHPERQLVDRSGDADIGHHGTASSLTGTTFDGLNNLRATATPPDPGIFLNHDFEMLYSGGRQFLSGLVEGGFFSRLGMLTTEYAAPNVITGFKPVRLTSQFVRDFPDAKTTLVIGDSFSAVSTWGLTVAYAGVFWAPSSAPNPAFSQRPCRRSPGRRLSPPRWTFTSMA
jgi:hypothetical protein